MRRPYLSTADVAAHRCKDVLAFANATRKADAHILVGVTGGAGTAARITGITQHMDDASFQPEEPVTRAAISSPAAAIVWHIDRPAQVQRAILDGDRLPLVGGLIGRDHQRELLIAVRDIGP
jgi:hypothetical protein